MTGGCQSSDGTKKLCIIAHNVDGSEIPRPITWDVVKTKNQCKFYGIYISTTFPSTGFGFHAGFLVARMRRCLSSVGALLGVKSLKFYGA